MTERESEIRSIPVDQITVLNPRVRNKRIFQELVDSIAHLGLKKPITVSKRAGRARYDLVCRQGRLEAFIALGQTEIPAIVVEASEEDCYVMSLVENLARRQHSPLELVHAIGALAKAAIRIAEIAGKVDFQRRVLSRPSACCSNAARKSSSPRLNGASSRIPSPWRSRAPRKARCNRRWPKPMRKRKSPATRCWRSGKIIEQRNNSGKQLHSRGRRVARARTVTAESLIRAYQRETERQKLLVKRASLARSRLLFVANATRRLLADEHFVALLRAEGLGALPRALAERIGPEALA